MRSSFWGLEVGRKALSSQQKALDVTGHNIANANTRGFTRQRAILTPTSPYAMPGFYSPVSAGQLGTGVKVEEVKRIRDQFIDLQIRDELRSLGSWEQKSKYLQKIEVFFNEPSDAGLRTVFSRFFDAVHDLAQKPGDDTARSLVIQRGHAVAENFNQMTRQFRDTTLSVDATLKAKINEVNSYSRQIRDLNEQIVRIENSGDNANDLRDKRDLILDDLAKLLTVDYMELEDGSLLVSTGGRSLVQSVYYKELDLKTYDSGDLKGQPKIVWKDTGEEYRFIKLSGTAESGKSIGSKVLPTAEFTIGNFPSGIRLTGNNPLDELSLSGSPLVIDSSSNQLNLTVNGITKTIVLSEQIYDGSEGKKANDLLNDLNLKLKEAFGDSTVRAFLADPGNTLVLANESGVAGEMISLENTGAYNNLFGSTTETVGNSFSIVLDGVTRTVVFPSGTYNPANFSDLADAITNSLGADQINVVWNSDHFEFTTASTGSGSSVWGFRGSSAALMGLDQVNSTPGKNREVRISGSGEIAGLWEVRAIIIPDYVEKMNRLMVRFTDAFNQQHQKGYDLNGEQGKDFFGVSSEAQNDVIKARYLEVVIANPNELAASATIDGIPGNGDNAWQIVGLRNIGLLNEGNASLDEFVRSTIGSLGIQSQEAGRMVDNQNLLVIQIENQRQSVSGVSLDEEITNLIKYQHAYGAAARMVTVVDEMLELIVSRLGIVGR